MTFTTDNYCWASCFTSLTFTKTTTMTAIARSVHGTWRKMLNRRRRTVQISPRRRQVFLDRDKRWSCRWRHVLPSACPDERKQKHALHCTSLGHQQLQQPTVENEITSSVGHDCLYLDMVEELPEQRQWIAVQHVETWTLKAVAKLSHYRNHI